jgi:hypothetical protein
VSRGDTSLGFRVGMKVEWRYYATLEEAQAAARTAIVKAEQRAAEGYDFGYQSPGAIRKAHSSDHGGLELGGYEGDVYEVVFP